MVGMIGRSGGARTGAGRRKLDSRYVLPEIEAGGITPLDYMLSVVRDPDAETGRRDRMAMAAAPYCHPRIVDRWAGGKEIKARKAKHAAVGTPWAKDLSEILDEQQPPN